MMAVRATNNIDPPESPGSTPSNQALRVSHIRFARDVQASESIYRRFTQPRSIVAVERPAELTSLSTDKPWPEALDDLYVILPSMFVSSEVRSTIDRWLAAPDHPEAPPPLVVQMDAATIRWRPGRAVVEGPVDVCKNLMAALVDFSFLEGELRRLEQELLPYEASAPEDIAFAYQIRQNDRIQWRRLGQTLQSISRLRLAFARLEPSLRGVSRSLPRDARKAITRLIAGSDVPSRLEAFDSRLEACEDLYEGAVDRIADFRWYRHGELLEIAIVVLLILELILIAWGSHLG
jgi:hypothetical protein